MKLFHGMLALGAALAISGGLAAAQPTEEIDVVAPHQVVRKVVGRGSFGAPIEEVTITYKVRFKDLDLKSDTGAAALEQRVKDAAKYVCDDLDKLYPKSLKENRRCRKRAVESAKDQMDTAIAAARK